MEQKIVYWTKTEGKPFKEYCDDLITDNWFIQQIIPLEMGTSGGIKSAYIIIYKNL